MWCLLSRESVEAMFLTRVTEKKLNSFIYLETKFCDFKFYATNSNWRKFPIIWISKVNCLFICFFQVELWKVNGIEWNYSFVDYTHVNYFFIFKYSWPMLEKNAFILSSAPCCYQWDILTDFNALYCCVFVCAHLVVE